jgi:hypothetical protein
MDVEYIIIIVIIIISVSFFLNYFFSNKAIIKRKLNKAAPRSIRSIRNGNIAKLIGSIEFVDEPLISPLSKRKCSYYYVHVEEKVSSGKSSHWETIIEETKSNKFVIKDRENYAFINDKKIKSYIVQDRNYSSGIFHDADESLKKYLLQYGIDSEGFLKINKSIRYKEGILEKGEKVAVLGLCKWQRADELGLPEHYKDVLTVSSPKDEYIYLSDDPDTTKINATQYHTKNYR